MNDLGLNDSNGAILFQIFLQLCVFSNCCLQSLDNISFIQKKINPDYQ